MFHGQKLKSWVMHSEDANNPIDLDRVEKGYEAFLYRFMLI